jgi:hypothetical protein
VLFTVISFLYLAVAIPFGVQAVSQSDHLELILLVYILIELITDTLLIAKVIFQTFLAHEESISK